jgi:sigma-E factor negative regulatory protein RseA
MRRTMEVMDKMDNQELISALADGQLQGEAFARGVQAASADARARESWFAYHVVGEVLRSGRAATGAPPEVFLARLQQRLRDEAPVTARPVAEALVLRVPPAPAANDWVWKLAAGVASVAAMTAVGWNLWGAGAGAAAPSQLAVAPAASAPATSEGGTVAMVRDPRLDQLLAAHRQLGGASVLQTSSGFLRNATFEAPGR